MQNVSVRNILIVVMVVFLVIQNSFFTRHDVISAILVFISTFIMYGAVSKYQANNKKMLRVNSKEGSLLHAFLSRENTLFIKVISFILSFVFSLILVLILKGISTTHGIITLFIIISIISLSIFNFINHNSVKNDTIESNLHEDISRHANEFLHLILVAFIMTFILSLILSARDTFLFLSIGDIGFMNFDSYAFDNRIEKNGYNDYSRILMNFYIILENFKMAFSNELVNAMIDQKHKEQYFYIFYVSVFILNMMKLFGFSIAFVFLQKGLENFAVKLQPYIMICSQKVTKIDFNALKSKFDNIIQIINIKKDKK